MAEHNTYGYIRVSSRDQNEARQLDALAYFSVATCNIFLDKLSGKKFDRPQWKKLMKCLKCGDILVILSIDRLGRNYEEILEQCRIITKEKQADIVVLDFPFLDTRARQGGSNLTARLVADLVLKILAYTAEKERENIRQRQAEGIAAAKARGVTWGRKKLPRPPSAERYAKLWRDGEISLNEIGAHWGVLRSTAYQLITEESQK